MRKYGKKINQKKNKYFNIIYILLFLFLLLLILFFIYVSLDRYSTYKLMKNDLSKKENRDFQKKLEIIEVFKEILEILKRQIEERVLDKIEDESLKQCIKLHNSIKVLTDQLNKKEEEDLNEKIKQILELLTEIIEYWDNNGYEKCFNPSSGTKNDIALCISSLSSHSPSLYNEPTIYPQISPRVNPSPDRENFFCPSINQFCSVPGNCPLNY